jgi:hypothetical protein
MEMVLDLTVRQAARVLEQALRSRATVQVEPRTWPAEQFLQGRLVGRDGTVLRLDVERQTVDLPLTALVGVCCDVRTILSDQLYLFATAIVDVHDTDTPPRLLLNAPAAVQVANRRRFARQAVGSGAAARVRIRPDGEWRTVELFNVGPAGLAFRAARPELDEHLLIGDDIDLLLQLPRLPNPLHARATICSKTPAGEDLVVGVDFVEPDDPVARANLTRFRTLLSEQGFDTGLNERGDEE